MLTAFYNIKNWTLKVVIITDLGRRQNLNKMLKIQLFLTEVAFFILFFRIYNPKMLKSAHLCRYYSMVEQE